MSKLAQRGAVARQTSRQRSDGSHVGFLAHRGYYWLKAGLVLATLSIVAYAVIDQQPRASGGSVLGLTLGTIGAGLIVWLTLLGYRKRKMTNDAWSLKAWTSAHVYLGLSLIVVGTLHTAFRFGWNVHTLAYVLMLLVIGSGLYGISVYAVLPRMMSENRDQMTESQMYEALQSVDRQLHDVAQRLRGDQARLVQASIDQDVYSEGIIARLRGHPRHCITEVVKAELGAASGEDQFAKVDRLLDRKLALLTRVRRHLRYKALLEIWLHVHVPLTFALIVALVAHIFAVFFYW